MRGFTNGVLTMAIYVDPGMEEKTRGDAATKIVAKTSEKPAFRRLVVRPNCGAVGVVVEGKLSHGLQFFVVGKELI